MHNPGKVVSLHRLPSIIMGIDALLRVIDSSPVVDLPA